MTQINKLISLFFLLTSFVYSNSLLSKPSDEVVVLNENNFVVIRGTINGQSTSKVVAKLSDNSEKDLYVYLNTGGGSVIDGMQIVQTLLTIQKTGRNIHCIGNVALSMGFVIMQFCQNRYVLESSILMQHQMSLGTEGQLMNIKSYMQFIDSMSESIDKRQAERMGMTLVDFKNKANHDWWMFGGDSVLNNAADKLVYIQCDVKGTEVDFVPTFFGEAKLTFSRCPLARHPLKIEFENPISNSTINREEALREIYKSYDLSTYIQDRILGFDKSSSYTL